MDYIKEIKLILINYILGYAKKLFCKIRQKTIETSVDKIVDLIILGFVGDRYFKFIGNLGKMKL